MKLGYLAALLPLLFVVLAILNHGTITQGTFNISNTTLNITNASTSTTSTSSSSSSTSSQNSTSTVQNSSISTIPTTSTTILNAFNDNGVSVSILPSNVILDAGQYATYTISVNGGIGPFNITLYNASGGANQGQKLTLAQQGSANVAFQTGLAGRFVFDAIVTDTGTNAPFTFNSTSNTIIVSNAPTLTISPSNSQLEPNQTETFTVIANGGTGPFNVEILNVNGSIVEGINTTIALPGGSNEISFPVNGTGKFTYNAIATDTGTTNPLIFNSTANTINVTTQTNLTVANFTNSTILLANATSIVPVNVALNLPNTINLSGINQSMPFEGGSVFISSISTVYQQPTITNIRVNYSKLSYGATTFINLISTYNTTLFIKRNYFKALNRNPNLQSIQAFELENTTQIINTSITNGNTTIEVPTSQNVSEWVPLSSSVLILAPGVNRFEITGEINPNIQYNWSYQISTIDSSNPSNFISLNGAHIKPGNLKQMLKLNPNIGNGTIGQRIKVGSITINPGFMKRYNFSKISLLNPETINIDPNWIVPNAITKIFNISLNNQQAVAITSNEPIAIPFNAENFTAYVNGGLTNYEIFNGLTGAIVPSWLETGASNTVSNGLIWVNLPASIPASTNAVNVISIGFISMSVNAMNGNNIGENPVLSTPYGKFDDGANVFNYYCNFIGKTLASCSGVGTASVDGTSASNQLVISNGITLAEEETATAKADRGYDAIYTNYPVTNNAVDVWVSNAPSTPGATTANVYVGLITSSTNSLGWIPNPANTPGNSVGYSLKLSNTQVLVGVHPPFVTTNVIGNAIGTNVVFPTGIGANGNVISVYGANVYGGSNSILGFNAPYTPEANSVGGAKILGGTYFAMVVNVTATTGGNAVFSANWIRVRAPPPNDVMPSAIYSAVFTNKPTTPGAISFTNTLLDAGQTEVFSDTFNSGISPYTFNWFVVNTITNAIVANQLYTGVANTGVLYTTNTFVWTTSTTNPVTNTVEANVIITDSGGSTVNTVYTGTITINAMLTTPSLTMSNTFIDQGQSILFTASTTGGTSPYSYNYYVVNSITNAIIANQLYASNSYTSNTWLWTPPPNLYTANTFKANVVIQDHATTAVTVNSPYNAIGYNSAARITISAPNTLLDSGQYATFTLKDTGGTGSPTVGFNAELYNVTGLTQQTQQGSNVFILTVGGTNTISFMTFSAVNSNTFKYNALETDLGTTVAFTNNSVATSITVNIPLTTTPTINYSTGGNADAGQTLHFASYESGGGTLPYTYNFLVFNSVTNTAISTQSGPSNTFAFVVNSATITNTIEANVIVIDSASTNELVNSVNTGKITLYSALSYPTITPASSITLDAGQSNTISAYETGGTGSYSYNFIVFNSITNVIIANLLTTSANSFTFTTNSLWTTNSPVKANVVVYDTGTITANNVNSVISSPITIDSALSYPTITPASPITLDAGQSNTISAYETGGTGSYSYNFIVFNSITNVIIANLLTTSANSFTFTTNSLLTTNSPVKANVVVYDTGTITANDVNSIISSPITIDSALSYPTITPASSITLDAGQSNTISAYETGGTGSYSYNFIVFNSITNVIIANLLTTSANSFTFTTNSLWTTNSPVKANVVVYDTGTITANDVNSIISSPITIDSALSYPTITPATPITLDAGQSNTISAYETGGTGSYSYNFIVFNSITNVIIANLLTTSANSFTFTTNSLWTTNSPVKANVVVYDTGTITANDVNSIISSPITIDSALSYPTITPATPITLDAGQSNTISAYETGGTGSYSYNFIVFNSITNVIIANLLTTSANSFTFTTNSLWTTNSPVKANVVVYDTGTITANDVNSIISSPITIDSALSYPTITPATPITLDAGQSNTISAYETGGTGSYSYNFIVFNSITNVIIANLLTTSANSFTFTTNSLWTTNSPVKANVVVYDTGTITANDVNSIISSPITIDSALSYPTITPATPITLDAGQSNTISAYETGGTGSYSYNFIVFNSITNVIIANLLTTSANSFTFTTNSLWTTNSPVKANVVVYDTGTITANDVNSIISSPITIDSALSYPTITPATPITLDAGQSNTISAYETGGTGSYSYNFIVFNSITNVIIANLLTTSANSFTFTTNSLWTTNSPVKANVVVYDTGTITANDVNSIISSPITIDSALSYPTITPATPITLDAGQSNTISAYETGGTGSYSYNFIVFNSITNVIIANLLTTSANSFTFTTNSLWTTNSPVKANVVVYDTGTITANDVNSIISSPITIDSALSYPTITPASSITLDAGQSNTISAYETGGTGSYSYNFIVFNSITNVIIANLLTTSANSFTFTTNSLWTTNSPVKANVVVYDTGTITANDVNSIISSPITIDSALSYPTITPATPITLDAGQSNTISAYETGGTGSYSYNFIVFNSITNVIIANLLTTSANSFTFTTNSLWTTNSPVKANVVVYDTGTITANDVNSIISSPITIDSALSYPTITPATPITLDAGQSNTISAYETGGTGSYSYNFIVFNSITNVIIANLLTTSANSFTFTTNSLWTTNSPVKANVVVYDTGTITANDVNSIISSPITIDSALSYPTITPATPITLDAGQSNTISAYETGGTGSYSYNFIVFNSITNVIIANLLTTSANSFTFTTNSLWTTNSPVKANVVVYDTGTITANDVNSIISSPITIDSALSYPTITPATPITLDAGQSNTISAYETGGTGSYSYNFIVFNSITNVIIANLLTTSANSFTFTTNSLWTTNSPVKANVVVYDTGTITANDVNSIISSPITIDSALSYPTITPATPITLDAGQSNTISAYETGGTGSYSYNFIVFNSITNVIIANLLTTSANSFTFTTNSLWTTNSPVKANVVVYDTGTITANDVNSIISSPITIDSAFTTTPTLSFSNTIIDYNQYETLTASGAAGGTSPYTYNFYTVSGSTATAISGCQYTTNTCAYTTAITTPTSFNVVVYDSATTNEVVNSITDTITNSVTAFTTTPTLSFSNTIIDYNQYETLTASGAAGGSSPYTYNFYTVSGSTATAISSCQHTTATCAYTTAITTPTSFNVVVYDSATTNEVVNSITDTITNSVTAFTTTPTLSFSNTIIDYNQYETLTASGAAGGTSPYTYNFYTVSGSTATAISGCQYTTNTCAYTTAITTPTSFNVVVYDSATTNEVVNSITDTITNSVTAFTTTPTLSFSNTIIDYNQYETLTASGAAGGSSPYTYNFYTVSGSTATAISSCQHTTATCAYTTAITTPTSFNVVVYDSATTNEVVNSITDTITNSVTAFTTTPTLSFSNTIIDYNQYETLTASGAAGGSSPYTYNFYTVSGSTATAISSCQHTTATCAYTTAITTPTSFNVVVYDSATTNEVVNSITDTITNSVTAFTTTPTLSFSNTIIDYNQYETLTASGAAGGTSPYTYNFYTVSGSTATAISSCQHTTATCAYTTAITTPTSFNVVVYDSATTNEVVNSITDTITNSVTAFTTTPTLSFSNTIIDYNQYETLTASGAAGGTSPYTYNFYTVSGSTATAISSCQHTTATCAYTTAITTPTSFNVVVYDSATTNEVVNSITDTITNSVTAFTTTPTLSFSNTIIDYNQYETLTASGAAGGSSPYTYNFYTVSGSTATAISSCQHTTATCAYTTAITTPTSFNVVVYDSATTNEVVNSITDTITNSVTAFTTTPTLSFSNTIIDYNQYETLTASGAAGGSSPYTYNFYTVSGSTATAISSCQHTTATCAYTTAITTPTSFNVVVYDSATTNEVVNSITDTITNSVTAFTTTPTLSFSNTIIDYNQYETLTASGAAGGTSPYTYNFYTVSGSTATAISSCQHTTATCAYTTAITTPTSFNVVVYDSATTNEVVNSITDTITNSVTAFTTTPTLSFSNTIIDYNQYETLTASGAAGGTSPYTYNFYTVSGSTATAISSCQHTTATCAYTTAITTPTSFNVVVYDSATTNEVVNSITDTITNSVTAFTTTPTLTPDPSLPATIVIGSTITFTATGISGGTAPYTYNFLVVNTATLTPIANYLVVNSVTSNVFSWTIPTADEANAVEVNVIISDSATTNEIVNSVYTMVLTIPPFNGYTPPSAPTLSLSNTFIDQGQSILFSATVTNGNQLFSYNYEIVNSITNTIIQNQIYTNVQSNSNTFLWTPAANLYTSNTFAANVVIMELGGFANTVNTVYTAFGYNSAFTTTPTLSFSNTIADNGQYETLTASGATGGTSPYTYSFIIFNSISNTVVANQLTSSNSFTFQSTSLWVTNSPLNANVIVTDGATTNEITNSVNTASVTVYNALSTPSITASNTPSVIAGEYELFSVSFSGGAPSYTYNYLVINTIDNTLIADMSLTNSLTSNSWLWGPIPAIDAGNTIEANVIITDSANSAVTVNSIYTPTITISSGGYAPPNTPSISVSNTIIDIGQSTTFSTTFTGGAYPYTYNWIIANSITGAIIENQLYNGVSGTSNSFLWEPNSILIGNTVEANVVVMDSHSPINTFNSVESTVIASINPAPNVIITPSASQVTTGQTETYTISITGGTGPFAIELFNITGQSQQGPNAIIQSPGGSNTISFVTSSSGTFLYDALITDQGTEQFYVFNSVSNTLTVQGNGGQVSSGGGGSGSASPVNPVVTTLQNGCMSITNVTASKSFALNINGYSITATESYMGSNFTDVIINGSTYVLYPGIQSRINGNPLNIQLVNVSYLPAAKEASFIVCQINVPTTIPGSQIVPQVSFTYLPTFTTLTIGTSYTSQLGVEDTAQIPEFVNMTVGQGFAAVVSLATNSLYLNPGQSVATQLTMTAEPSLSAGTYIIPINMSISTPGDRSTRQAQFLTLVVFSSNPTKPSILNQISIANYTGTEGQIAMGTIEITSPANASITNATLQTMIPNPLVSNGSTITTSGIPGNLSIHNGTYFIDWHITYLPPDGSTFAYYTIKNPQDQEQLFRIQNQLAVPSPGPIQLPSILKIINISVPTFYTSSINHILVHALYTGTSAGRVNFTIIGPSGSKMLNSTLILNATPGQYLTSNFEIDTDGKTGTMLLTLYISANGAETTYTLPVIIFKNSQESLLSQLQNVLLSSGIIIIIFAAVLFTISMYFARRGRRKGAKFSEEQWEELKNVRDQIENGSARRRGK